jgi:hypothetical protein
MNYNYHQKERILGRNKPDKKNSILFLLSMFFIFVILDIKGNEYENLSYSSYSGNNTPFEYSSNTGYTNPYSSDIPTYYAEPFSESTSGSLRSSNAEPSMYGAENDLDGDPNGGQGIGTFFPFDNRLILFLLIFALVYAGVIFLRNHKGFIRD